MNHRTFFLGGMIVGSLLVSCAVTFADEQAAPAAGAPLIRWGAGVSSNNASDARNLPADPNSVAPLWEIKLGTHQYSIPTIDRGRIYIATDDAGVDRPGYKPTGGGVLRCVDQVTGKLIWQFITPRYMAGVKAPYHYDQWKCGICSGPLVEGDRVYVVGSRGEVLCLNRNGQANGNTGPFTDELAYMGIDANIPGSALGPTDGDIIWRYNMLDEGVIPHDVCGSTLLIVGDLIYACTSNGLDDKHYKVPAPFAPTLIVLDKNTGKLVAKDDEKIGTRLLHCNWSSPIAGQVGGKTLVFFAGGDGVLYAFEPVKPSVEVQTLKKVWSYDCNPESYRFRDGQPITPSNHTRKTPDGPSEVIGGAVFHNGRVYVAIGQSPVHGIGQGYLSCVDAATGAKVWGSPLVERTLATPAIADGLLYIPDTTGNLHCFDANSGERYWVHNMGFTTWPASAFVADGKVYASTEAGVLWVLKAGKELQVLSRTRFKTPPTTVTAADGVLYIPTQKSLIAVPGTKP